VPSVDSERSLAERLRADDQTALRALVAQHWHALVAVAMITTHSEDLAIEAVQDAFIGLWERRATLDPARAVEGALYTSARYRAIDLMRRERAHARMTHRLAQLARWHPPVSYNAGEQEIEAAEFDAHAAAAIQGLPPRCREVFLLNRKAGLSYTEIASTLGISVLTARNQMSLALQRMTQAMAEWRKQG